MLDYQPAANGDWSEAIQRAVDENDAVYFPGGAYRVTRPVNLNRAVTVYGDGPSSLLVQDTSVLGRNFTVFWARAPGATIRKLGFRGMNRTTDTTGFAVRVHWVGGVTVDSIRVDSLGMVFTDHAEPNTVIKNSVGDGGRLLPWDTLRGVNHGILLTHSRGVEVVNDTLRNYGNGIEWWGIFDHAGQRHLLTSDHTIHHNFVSSTGSAIWGSGGQNIRVEQNTAIYCHDVCFDAENSRKIWFVGNTGKFAGTAVLAVFFRADSIFFERNNALQGNTGCSGGSGALCWPNHPHRSSGDPVLRERVGQRLFSMRDGSDTTYQSTRVYLRGNRLEHGDHIGFVDKTPSSEFSMDHDTLVNTVVHLESGRNGRISLRWLDVTIRHYTHYAGIKVATHEFEPLVGTATHIEGNHVRRWWDYPSNPPGIDVYLRSSHPLHSVITGNIVSRYNVLSIAAHGDDAAHTFAITNNGTTGPINFWGSPQPSVSTSGNYDYRPPADPTDPDPPCGGSTGTMC